MLPKIVAAAFVTLDGVMQAPGGPQENPTGGFAWGGRVFPVQTESFALEQPDEAEIARRETMKREETG